LAEDALDLLPGAALRGDLQLLQELGMLNRVFISLEDTEYGEGEKDGVSPELLASAQAVGERLSESALFREVFFRLPEGYEFSLAGSMRQSLPALIDAEDLLLIEKRLEPVQLREVLRNNFKRLNSLAGLAMAGQIQSDPLDFTSLIFEKMAVLRGGLNLSIQNGFFVSPDGRNCLLWAESTLPLTSSGEAALVKEELDKAFAAGLGKGVRARIIGPLPHTLANVNTIRHDLARLLPVAMAALVCFLLLFLKNWRALMVVAIPFLAAPPAVALLAMYSGTVSGMALGFGIVLLGIGVDFAIHIYVGCRGIQGEGSIPINLQGSLLMAALTTISVFVVLFFSAVPAHRQMAFLAVTGLSWALYLSWNLVPFLGRAAGVKEPVGSQFAGRLINISLPKQINKSFRLTGWLLLLLAGVICWPGLRYNGDLRTLDVSSEKVRQDEQHFHRIWGQDEEQIFLVSVSPDRGQTLDINDRVYESLRGMEKIENFQSLSPIVPGPVRQQQNINNWQRFWEERLAAGFREDLEAASLESGFTADAFQPFADGLLGDVKAIDPEEMMSGVLRPLAASLFRKTISLHEEGGSFLAVTIIPDNSGTAGLVNSLPGHEAGVTVLSNSKWRQQVERQLREDISWLSAAAAFIVILICLFFFRNVRTVIAVLAPVMSALAAMVAFSYFNGGELNTMHVLMGIMVIGLSVDYGIFVARACSSGFTGDTFLAVSICAVSTLSGFGVLSFAEHPALHSLGVTVLVGIGSAWPTALMVTPVLLPDDPEDCS